jgi:hypothetical protein
MDVLLQHTRLRVAAAALPVPDDTSCGDVVLESASIGMSINLQYCTYLVSVLGDAIRVAIAASGESDHLSLKWSVFCTTWHGETLARLSDADIANAWRLADYVLLDATCFRCLQDVVVQRRARAGSTLPVALNGDIVGYPSYSWHLKLGKRSLLEELMLPNQSLESFAHEECDFKQLDLRVESIWDDLDLYRYSNLPNGTETPKAYYALCVAAKWGHEELVMRSYAELWLKLSLTGRDLSAVAKHAAIGGHLRLLQRLRQAGCPWSSSIVYSAGARGHTSLALWALENGAPFGSGIRESMDFSAAVAGGCLPVLEWLHSKGRLPSSYVSFLRREASSSFVTQWHGKIISCRDRLLNGRTAIKNWLDSLGRHQ